MQGSFAVGATAVLPYSDNGASGEGLRLHCVSTEAEAIATAVDAVRHFVSLLHDVWDTEGARIDAYRKQAQTLCQQTPGNLQELDRWFRSVHDAVEAHALSDAYYDNPKNVLTLEIRNVAGDALFPIHA